MGTWAHTGIWAHTDTWVYHGQPMCPNVPNEMSHIFNFQCRLSIVNSCVSMCPCAPMCPMVWYALDLIRTYYLWDWLFIVNSCVSMCPYAPMWPMIWYSPISSETGCSLWHHVFVCVHVPNDLCHIFNLQYCLSMVNSGVFMYPCGQEFETYLFFYNITLINLR